MEPNPQIGSQQNFYRLLGVTSKATCQEIKKAFRRQAMKWHPDKNQSSEAKQMFTNIKYAYEVLANHQTREQYDNSGKGDDQIVDIAGTLDSFGERLSEKYKKFVQQKIMFFQTHKFINNCDIQQKINKIFWQNGKSLQKNKSHYKKLNQDQKQIAKQVKKLMYSQSFIGWPQVFAQVHAKHSEQLRDLYRYLVPDKKSVEFFQKVYGFKIKLLQALILKAEQMPLRCLEKLEQAILFLPDNEAQVLMITIISDDNFRKQMLQALSLQNVMIDLEVPQKLVYGSSLRMNKILLVIQKYDKQISQMGILEGAYTYIDLCRALRDPVSLFGCLTLSCVKFLKYIKQSEDREKYAYCKLVEVLAWQIMIISMKYFTPNMHLYGLKLALSILINSNRYLNTIKDNCNIQNQGEENICTLVDENGINQIQNITEALCKIYLVCPFSTNKVHLVFDLIYVDVILRGIINCFLQKMENANDELIPNYLASYYLFQGVWGGWYEGDFQKRRQDCMNKFLQEKNWEMEKCQQILQWPLIKRQNGWITSQQRPLQFQGENYTSFDGFTIDFQTGEIELVMTPKGQSQQQQGLFDNQDIQDIFSAGVQASFFTLESPNHSLINHPMQEFRYAPESISQTNYLGTLLHADYLLKMFTTGVQINAQAPFQIRDISEGLTKRLPTELRQKITLPKSNLLGQAHRFWIEAGEVPHYNFSQEDCQKITYMYGSVQMKVKTHLLKRNANGQLVDDADNEENQDEKQLTPEEIFAKNFTENYDQIGKYYPVLLRLKQLVKISAAYNSIKRIFQYIKSEHQDRKKLQTRINEALTNFRSTITFPINTQSRRNDLFQKILMLNNVQQYQVLPQQRQG